MENENESIKLGRISRPMERALGISLPSDVNIYMKSEDIDALAAKRPDSYLKTIGEIAYICKQPDFVSFDEKENLFTFLRFYCKNGSFYAVYVTVNLQGTPQKWHYFKIGKCSPFPADGPLKGREFVRPEWKNPRNRT